MSKPVWIFLGIGAFCVLGAFAVVPLMVDYLVPSPEETRAAYDKGVPAGARFGEDSDEAGCHREVGRRTTTECGRVDTVCFMENIAFYQGCLATARPTPGFCDNVPNLQEIEDKTELLLKGIDWVERECETMGIESSSHCAQFLAPKQVHCSNSAVLRTKTATKS